MNTTKTKLLRIMASAAVLSMLPMGLAVTAQAATPSAISVQMATAPSPASDSYTNQILTLINQKRAEVGSAPVKWNQSIGNVSQDWAEHLGRVTMDPNFDFANIHRSDAGGSLIPQGATWYRENIAFNGSAQSIVDWWMNSPGHKAAMLDPKATDIGIGYGVPPSGPYAGWHQVVTNFVAYPGSVSVIAGTQYKTTIQLNLRSGGGLEYPVIGSGVAGTIVTATGRTNGIWYEVKMDNQTGWMSSEYLTRYASPSSSVISYAGHVQNVGWQTSVSNGGTAGTIGQGLRLESVKFTSAGQTARAHVENIGWQNYSSGAATIGTSGQGLRMEAVQVRSTVPGESIRCQAHVENIGWMAEVGDGEICGTTGQSLRLEAVRFRIVKQ
jgi:uncharacterized protein YkwD/uncharacterized protein YraI